MIFLSHAHPFPIPCPCNQKRIGMEFLCFFFLFPYKHLSFNNHPLDFNLSFIDFNTKVL